MESSSPTEAELQTRIRQQEVVADLGQEALETDDLDQLMHNAAEAVVETLDSEYADVLELLPGGETVLLRQGVGWRDGLVGRATVPAGRDSQAGYTLLTDEPVIVEDLRTEERFSSPELLAIQDVVSAISVVDADSEVRFANDRAGVIVGRPPEEPTAMSYDDSEWVISVSDEGVGIDPADADQVFEVFQSLQGHDGAGSGIGLALCERIVERHGGDIWVDSEPGDGAAFSFTLPAAGETGE